MADKPLLDKLEVKPGHRVSVLGLDEQWFVTDLSRRGADVSFRRRKGSDLVFLACGSPRELDRIGGLEPYLVRNGAVWVLTRRGSRGSTRTTRCVPAWRSDWSTTRSPPSPIDGAPSGS